MSVGFTKNGTELAEISFGFLRKPTGPAGLARGWRAFLVMVEPASGYESKLRLATLNSLGTKAFAGDSLSDVIEIVLHSLCVNTEELVFVSERGSRTPQGRNTFSPDAEPDDFVL